MTRAELQKIKKPRTGLVIYKMPKDPSGYCKVGLQLEIANEAIIGKTVSFIMDIFRAKLTMGKPK